MDSGGWPRAARVRSPSAGDAAFGNYPAGGGGPQSPRGEDSGVWGGQSARGGPGAAGRPLPAPGGASPRGCGLLRVRPGPTPRGRRAAASPRPAPPGDGERVRRSQVSASLCQPAARGRGFLPGSVRVCARGDRSRLKPPLSVTARGGSTAPHASLSRPRPPSLVGPAGEAPPSPGSGGREAIDHLLPPRTSQAEGWGAGQWAPGGGVRRGGVDAGAGPRPLFSSCLEAGTIKSFSTDPGGQDAEATNPPLSPGFRGSE